MMTETEQPWTTNTLKCPKKTVFGEEHMKFPCPLLLTSVHFLMQWIFSVALTEKWSEFWGGEQVRSMSWAQFLSISLPCGLVTSGDIGLSNLAISRLKITFYTMVKASSPVFVLLWAYLLGIERITYPLFLVVLIIASGEFLAVRGEVHFQLVPFLQCLAASFLSGARWTLVQLKLQNLDPPLKTMIATMRVLAPSMFVSMFVIALIIEEPWVKLAHVNSGSQMLETFGLGVLGGTLAIAMIICEFDLIMRSSAIILMIGGVIKEMITILLG